MISRSNILTRCKFNNKQDIESIMREISIQSKHKDGLSANLSGIFAWELMNKGIADQTDYIDEFLFRKKKSIRLWTAT